ncbi:DUF4845 domain-containing protein [Litorivicinus lipolyticus]|uniref:DUF4845 domain-containing protein n=1 Tax=Litorivicinus lipolyticus TaxID=418701 RepID=UPI003B5B814F
MRQQSGFSLVLVAVLVGLLGFAGLFALRVGPLYFDHWVIQEIFADLEAAPEALEGQSSRQIRRDIDTKLRVNNLSKFVARDALGIERNGNQWLLSLDYERRTPFVAEVDLVVSFAAVAAVGEP